MNTKTLFSLGMVAMMAIPGFAQSGNQAPFEFDLKVGTNIPLNSYLDASNKLGVSLGLESRWNLRNKPMDIGAELYLGSAVRHNTDGSDLSNRTFSLSIISDYQMNRGSSLSPFVGLGVGVARCEQIQGSCGEEGTTLCLIPRVGLNLTRHLRITADAHISKKNYSHVGFSVGYSFHK